MDAKELYTICTELAHEGPTTEARRRMHEVLTLCCAEAARGHGTFGNLFAQVDFVCKRYGLKTNERRALQTMRRHSNGADELSADDWLYDLRALTRLIQTVTKEGVPQELLDILPHRNRQLKESHQIDKVCVRCIVKSWDEQTITASTEEGDIVVDYGSTDDGRDLSHLKKLLREGMQLNLLECSIKEGEKGNTECLWPRLVVVEPDFLIDVSALAACFTSYGHHPLLYTVNRLKSRPNTQAVLLGNFAGAALDEIISHPEASTAEVLRRSFREQALRFCACDDFNAERFRRDSEVQVQNIREAVNVLFTEKEERVPLLEPSFVCERLGMQGRVDLMTADMSLLVEQKSGRNMKIEKKSHDAHGMQREDHYVQLLLYYGILRYNFGRTDLSVDTKLLYSKYGAQDGLLSVNYYRTLLREAIALRNQVVATELLAAREGFGRILPLLTAGIIYKGVERDEYFIRYVLPEIETLTQSLAMLNPLERAYLEQMMTFVYREQRCQKLGCAETRLYHSAGAVSDLWQMPLAEKKASGNIITELKVTELAKKESFGGYDLVTLEGLFTEVLNFRRGDMIYLYAYRDTPDVCKSILYKGTLEELTGSSVVVRLNDGQQDKRIFEQQENWAIEHGSSDVMTGSCMRALLQLITAEPERRQLLLGQRQPRKDVSKSLSRSYSNTYDDILCRVKQACDYFLLVGPPGTGKTTQALRYIIREEQGKTLLLTAYTNRAVDEICEMLDTEGLDYLRIGNEAACHPRFRHHLIEEQLEGNVHLESFRRKIEETAIVVGTTATLSSRQEIFSIKHFAMAIVDEASQILEPQLIGLLSSAKIDRFILIGDYKQLPAVVQQSEEDAKVENKLLRDIALTDCRQSLFERLIRWEQHCERTDFIGTLNRQGRMHPDVASFPSSNFYHDEHLQTVPLPHQQEEALDYTLPSQDAIDELLKARRVLFVDPTEITVTKEEGQRSEGWWTAQFVERIRRFYGKTFDADKTVGVIVTYRSQIAPIRQLLEQTGDQLLASISIDTVERYQGSQRDVIVYAFGVDHRYQLGFLTANTFEEHGRMIDRKLNVAMTRARRQLIMVGHAEILDLNPLLKSVIGQYQARWPQTNNEQ